MNILITTGGTGGHIFPALALAKEIQAEDKEAKILFVGGNYGMEKELCKQAGLEFIGFNVRGLVGRGFKSISAFFAMFKAYFHGKKVIKERKIDKVIGFGGYASSPCILAAISLKTELYLHEQNAFLGMANKYFAEHAKKVFLSVPLDANTGQRIDEKKTLLVGNPIREEIAKLANLPLSENQGKTLLVLGGSLGAKSINSIMISLLPDLHKRNIKIIHQCGKKDYERVKEAYSSSPYNTSVVHAFIENMAEVFMEANIIIARAGASTIAELACVGKPAILIPFPLAAHNHQYYNGKALADKEACVLLEENTMYKDEQVIESKILLEKIDNIFENKDKQKKLSRNIRSFAKPNAVKDMYKEIKD